MHTRDYSEDTSRVVDEEIERILRAQELRAEQVLSEHRAGLEAGRAALCSSTRRSTGAEIARLVDEAYGRPVHGIEGKPGSDAERYAPSLTGGSASPIVPPPQPEPAVVAQPVGVAQPASVPPSAWAPPGGQAASSPPLVPPQPPSNGSGSAPASGSSSS